MWCWVCKEESPRLEGVDNNLFELLFFFFFMQQDTIVTILRRGNVSYSSLKDKCVWVTIEIMKWIVLLRCIIVWILLVKWSLFLLSLQWHPSDLIIVVRHCLPIFVSHCICLLLFILFKFVIHLVNYNFLFLLAYLHLYYLIFSLLIKLFSSSISIDSYLI